MRDSYLRKRAEKWLSSPRRCRIGYNALVHPADMMGMVWTYYRSIMEGIMKRLVVLAAAFLIVLGVS